MYPKVKKGMVCKKLGEEAMLYDPSSENVHVLNATSLFIWNLLDGLTAPVQIEKKMREAFSVSENTDILGDVIRTINEFDQKDLLE